MIKKITFFTSQTKICLILASLTRTLTWHALHQTIISIISIITRLSANQFISLMRNSEYSLICLHIPTNIFVTDFKRKIIQIFCLKYLICRLTFIHTSICIKIQEKRAFSNAHSSRHWVISNTSCANS